jgi:hypothetical protein
MTMIDRVTSNIEKDYTFKQTRWEAETENIFKYNEE